MADAYARVSGRLGVLTRAPGPGLTNAMTGITEAAKSRTPLLVLAADTRRSRGPLQLPRSTRRAGRGGRRGRRAGALRRRGRGRRGARRAATAVGAAAHGGAEPAARRPGRRTAPEPPAPAPVPPLAGAAAGPRRVGPAGRRAARRPSGRCSWPAAAPGARRRAGAGAAGRRAAARCWPPRPWPRGCSRGSPWDLDVSGGFASPLAAELIGAADLVVAWGCALNMWTTRHGRLIGRRRRGRPGRPRPGDALGAHRPVDLGVLGDVAATAAAALADGAAGRQRRLPHRRASGGRIAARGPLARRAVRRRRSRPAGSTRAR